MKDKKIKNIFVQGGIPPDKIATSIANHQSKTHIGAHAIFMGQVRADELEDKIVHAIEYTAQEQMANQVCEQIREEAFKKYDLSCMHIYHSLGKVPKGEICLWGHAKPVFTSFGMAKRGGRPGPIGRNLSSTCRLFLEPR